MQPFQLVDDTTTLQLGFEIERMWIIDVNYIHVCVILHLGSRALGASTTLGHHR